jgi:hypothetical protein
MIANNVVFEDKKPQQFMGFHVINGTLPSNLNHAVGVDPGVNFGLTIIHGSHIRVIYGKFPSERLKGWHGINVYKWMLTLFGSMETRRVLAPYQRVPAIVEGAAYHSQFGQVGLEEVRFAFFLALHILGFEAEIVPPATIRKNAFNDGKMQAGDVWPWMNHNGADSLGCALCALEKHDDQDKSIS